MRPAKPKAIAIAQTEKLRGLIGPTTVLAVAALALSGFAAFGAETIKSHGISTFGNLKYPADFPHLEYVNPDAPKGGEISEWTLGAYDSLNPYTQNGRGAALASIFYEGLMEGTSDEIGSSYCLICESIEYPEDRAWVIFNLRDFVTFSDGSPLTAEDVKFSFELFRDKGLPSFRAQLQKKVETVEVIDPQTVKFTFKEDHPKRDLIQEMGGIPLMSKADYEANDRDLEEPSNDPFLGSGPYVLDTFDIGRSITYKRNPDYWGADLPINLGRHNFDGIRIEYYGDSVAAFEGFKGGDYTFRNENSSKGWATSYDFPALEKGDIIKAEIPHQIKATGQGFILNLRREKFQDPRVREAVGLMFNFEWANETLFYGLYDRVNSFWDNSYLKAEGIPPADELALLETIADILPPGVIDDIPLTYPLASTDRQLDRRQLRRASSLLDEAGWMVGDDGMRRNASGQLLTIEFLNDSQAFDRIINPYVENLRRLGVDASLNRIDNAQMTRRERPPEYDFDVITQVINMGYEPGSSLFQYFGSETADTSVFNKAGLKSPAADALIEMVLKAESKEELDVAVRALDRVLRAERFWIPQWNKNAYTVAYYNMYEHPENLPPFALGELDFWWYNAEKAEALKASGAL